MRKPFRSVPPVAALLLALLACTSNDTLFIRLTATPSPAPSATAVTAATRFKVGDRPVLVAVSSPMMLLASPNPNDKSGGSDLCFSGTQVTITEIGLAADKTVYYRIKCAAAVGWAAEANLTPFKPGENAALREDRFLTNDPEPDVATNRAASTACKIGASVGVLDLAMNPADHLIYAQVQCGAASGWLPESALGAAK